MDVSVILVSYNTLDLTRNCLKSLYEKTNGVNFEIFVVDNNSKDGSPEMVEREFPDVKLIRNSENKGFGAANNIAIRKSSAKYILCLNTDTVLTGNSIKQFFDYMEQNPDAGAMGGQLTDINGNPLSSVGFFAGTKRLLFSLFGLRYIFPKYYEEKFALVKAVNYDSITEVDSISGADLFLRKSLIDKIGAFDEQFFMYFEETDLCYRVHKAGYKVIYFPQSRIIHLEGRSFSPSKMQYHRSSMLKYYKKNVGYLPYLILKFLFFVKPL
ncbi:MAG: glycosyltransferase family 2 protein [Candidatus Avigastranaerophilus sp.]